ncbi:hypothetical protein J2Y66_002679 [Paenarthrobacter nitroguajacolicus]|uniref:DUF6318 family protein n=1 Tax=Paenarthrobacter nitroguajacolicus TaxID=211146 RepID=UPI0028639C33|nr:DUF6318 family protein [Paenarthrobacter nitroguajacolicus]MDR6988175.1 hypothetical protein [Paenarthrobacter nitroguajacolicus]
MSRDSYATFPSLHARMVVIGLAAAVLLSGCRGGSTPSTPSSEQSSTTASPASSALVPAASATPSASAGYKPADAKGKAENVPVPVMPELAKENSKAGLEAFIEYWYATYSYATETGDLTAWMASTDTTTESGGAYKRAIELNYTRGRWVVGGRITIPIIEVLWKDGLDLQSAKVQVIQEQIQYFDAEGRPGQQTTPAYNTAEAVMARYQSGAWAVIDNGLIVG